MTRLPHNLSLLALALAGVTSLAACSSDAGDSTGPLAKQTSKRSPTAPGTADAPADKGTGKPDNPSGTPSGNAGTPGGNAGTPGGNAGTPGGSAETPSPSAPAPDATPSNPGTPSGPNTTPPPPAAAADFEVLVANPAVALDLQAETTLQVTLAPKGYAGPVALSVMGLAAGATATFAQPSVTLSGTAGVTAMVTVKSGTAVPGDSTFKIVATAGALTHDASASLKVNPKLTIMIPQNANTLAKVFGNVELSKGAGSVVVTWQNPTNEAVTIHRQNNAAGMTHGNPIAPGGSEARTVTAAGSFTFYVHNGAQANQSAPGSGLLVVK